MKIESITMNKTQLEDLYNWGLETMYSGLGIPKYLIQGKDKNMETETLVCYCRAIKDSRYTPEVIYAYKISEGWRNIDEFRLLLLGRILAYLRPRMDFQEDGAFDFFECELAEHDRVAPREILNIENNTTFVEMANIIEEWLGSIELIDNERYLTIQLSNKADKQEFMTKVHELGVKANSFWDSSGRQGIFFGSYGRLKYLAHCAGDV